MTCNFDSEQVSSQRSFTLLNVVNSSSNLGRNKMLRGSIEEQSEREGETEIFCALVLLLKCSQQPRMD